MQVQHFQTVNFSLRLLHNADYVATSRKDISHSDLHGIADKTVLPHSRGHAFT